MKIKTKYLVSSTYPVFNFEDGPQPEKMALFRTGTVLTEDPSSFPSAFEGLIINYIIRYPTLVSSSAQKYMAYTFTHIHTLKSAWQ